MKLFQAFQLTDKVKLFSTVNILLMTMQIVPWFVTVESKSLSSGKFLPATCKPCNALAAARKSIVTAEVHTVLNTVWCFHKVQLLIYNYRSEKDLIILWNTVIKQKVFNQVKCLNISP